MRHTLRRSCAACAKSKHGCDLRTPRCSRCIKRKTPCLYANEPLTGLNFDGESIFQQPIGPELAPPGEANSLTSYNRFGSVDPFDSYPRTRLPRNRVQRLMHHFLNKIAFQYYPLDPSATSNPFLISWWPLALGDPTLFHVSLQTASLDEELLAQKGFQTSDVLMADSLVLLRRRVEDTMLAMQDATMDSIITLAAIEFGKGNVAASQMHVDGVKRLVDLRGGLNAVRQTSPLTARMVSWVSMILTCQPQFDTQDDFGVGDGVAPIPTWRMNSTMLTILGENLTELGINHNNTNHEVRNVLVRLRSIFHHAQRIPLPPTWLHDLTCFTVHRLLLSVPDTAHLPESSFSECVRHAIVLYMFIIQGPTYFSHAVMVQILVTRFIKHLEDRKSRPVRHDSIEIWYHSIGLVVSSPDSAESLWFSRRAKASSKHLQLNSWDDASVLVKRVLWLEIQDSEDIFRTRWEACIGAADE